MRRTNSEVALESIAQVAGCESNAVLAHMMAFYTNAYPDLRDCVEMVPHAADAIHTLQDRGLAVVIATNPLYPLEAVRQRLAWAGVPDAAEAYALVTHSENMHFCKPEPAYYGEILARVGIEPDEAVMVGDSIGNDLIPAEIVGLHTFRINGNHLSASGDGRTGTIGAGSLENCVDLILNTDFVVAPPPIAHTPHMIEPQLRGNVGALYGMLVQVQPHFWRQQPDPNEWSILQILCHLVDSERTIQQPRLTRILREHNPFLAASKTPQGADMPLCDDDGYRIAEAFTKERENTLRFLRELAPDDWNRPGRHSIFGPTTLLEMAHFTAQHDRLHLNQLCQTMGKCS
jgi:HAD superfamily hydrolase (TIGR01662 family)